MSSTSKKPKPMAAFSALRSCACRRCDSPIWLAYITDRASMVASVRSTIFCNMATRQFRFRTTRSTTRSATAV